MCQAANQYALGFSVYQRKGDWFVRDRAGREFAFYDGIVIERYPVAVAA
jgi:hypothetical protein